MKLMIDTNADSKEDLLAAKQLIESVLAKRGVVSNTYSYQSTNSENDRLQRKLAKAKAKEDSTSQAAPAIDMFGSNTNSESDSQQSISSQTQSVPVMDMFGGNEPSQSSTDYSTTHEPDDEEDENQNIQILPY